MLDSLLIAVDGGQTSTRAALAQSDGTLIAIATSAPQDHVRIGGEARARLSLATILTDLAGHVPAGSVDTIVLGLTSIDDEDTAIQFVERVVRETICARLVLVVPDRVTCLAGATGGAPGIVVIAGGGSIGFGVDPGGRTALVGGYGYRFADDGSATDIGRKAVLAAARASDGRGPRTRLEQLVKRCFGVSQLREVIGIVYSADFTRNRLAELAPDVVSLADEGDEVARRIVAAAVDELSATAVAALAQLYVGPRLVALQADPPKVHLVGGLFGSQRVREGVRLQVQTAWPVVEVAWAPNAPLLGALIHAGRASGVAVDRAWVTRAETSLRTSAGTLGGGSGA